MQIKVDMPFKECETCPKCSLRVEEQVSFLDEFRTSREIRISCRNDRICHRAWERVEKDSNDVQ